VRTDVAVRNRQGAAYDERVHRLSDDARHIATGDSPTFTMQDLRPAEGKEATINSSPAERRSAGLAGAAQPIGPGVDADRGDAVSAIEGRAREEDATPRFFLLGPKRNPVRRAFHERSERLRLDVIGAHDRADERVRQELLDCWTIALRHEVSLRFGGESDRGLFRDAGVDSHRRPMLLSGNSQ
jgi:hypothetical protein